MVASWLPGILLLVVAFADGHTAPEALKVVRNDNAARRTEELSTRTSLSKALDGILAYFDANILPIGGTFIAGVVVKRWIPTRGTHRNRLLSS
jgi:hypothetical protein